MVPQELPVLQASDGPGVRAEGGLMVAMSWEHLRIAFFGAVVPQPEQLHEEAAKRKNEKPSWVLAADTDRRRLSMRGGTKDRGIYGTGQRGRRQGVRIKWLLIGGKGGGMRREVGSCEGGAKTERRGEV